VRLHEEKGADFDSRLGNGPFTRSSFKDSSLEPDEG